MASIDIPTLLFVFVLTGAAIATFFAIEAFLFRKRDAGTVGYILIKFAQVLSVGLLLLPEYPHRTDWILLHNVFYFYGFTGEFNLVISLHSPRPRRHRNILMIGAILACLFNVSNLLLDGRDAYRLVVVGAFTFFLFLYFGAVLLFQKDRRKMYRIAGWISILFSVPWALRMYYVVLNLSTAELMGAYVYQTIAYVSMVVFFTVLPFLYLLIIREQDRELKQKQYEVIKEQVEEITLRIRSCSR
ncbi:MAG: hypothetical protein R2751_09930 [Bacteroidales bacterium]